MKAAELLPTAAWARGRMTVCASFGCTGSPGVGKSTVAWQLYEDLAAGSFRCGYVDIDQLGMCYPASEDDADRHRLKGTVLAALLPNYAAAGVRALIVSGVLDPT